MFSRTVTARRVYDGVPAPQTYPALRMPSVSAVISTFERPDACERALRSALAQEPAPDEVLVCDDGSRDSTSERLGAWERRDGRVRYIRVEPNRGTPAPARNAGVAAARGEWVAFLDDDDEWLPGKLAAQLAHVDDADVIATNATTTTGAPYFPQATVAARPGRREMLADNPVINSSAVVRRSLLQAAGGFPVEPWLRGLEDYAAWLALADAGARFLVLGEPLVRYETHGDGRMSGGAPARVELAAARLAWRRLLRRPRDPALLRAALNKTAAAAQASPRLLKISSKR
jgi:glycosyltransferase involved in cell wall biosynthesis